MDPYNEEWVVPYEGFEDEKIKYKESNYEIVSKIAYLIGVPKRVFENEHEPPQMDIYKKLNLDKNARIIRHLCILRTSIERSFKHISQKMRFEYRSLYSLPEHIPQDSLNHLSDDGIVFYQKTSALPIDYIIEINRILSDRINNCKYLFPLWLNWTYVRDLFIMPNGLTESGTRVAANTYFSNLNYYPYQVYINWDPSPCGNILYNDKKFVTYLYQWHNDCFTEFNKVTDASNFVKSNVYDFIDKANKVVMAVDCENSDPYRLCATLKGLDEDVICKIQKIMLFDDVHTANAWRILESHTTIPVEHIMTERVKQSKSLVDIELTARTCTEHYRNNVDSFVIVSSDSDYWGLISSLPEARFLVMIEREKCGPDMKAALINSGIFYCSIDDFYSGNSEDIKREALFKEIYRRLHKALQLNVNDMFEAAILSTRVTMTSAEKQQFFDKHLRQMKLVLDEQGNASLELKRK